MSSSTSSKTPSHDIVSNTLRQANTIWVVGLAFVIIGFTLLQALEPVPYAWLISLVGVVLVAIGKWRARL
ncbi:Uncharacterised protein [BD1-7 clade bacterium]|uniref:Uncharacterized protein n=1 Tax=BD1-7 clade bacterium TaxID=2029982 RepID=A0A5S9PJ49_9GAMM|nr:Uncharacterised protein [BD1-7 clade bacterium]